ncbi:MAG: ABC transporter permease [Chloroflexi bacterium CFX4]|nr:ABC transporter permease [Chloroflexi bacterium CFX4]MDL1923480.1 ABC transporter permease [Chloroflexi bacterium CFX3]
MAVASKPLSLGKQHDETKTRTPLSDAWNQFRRNRLALVGMGFIIFLIVIAVGADVLQSIGFLDNPLYQHEAPGMTFAPPMTCTQDPRRMDPQWCFVFGTDDLRRDMMSRAVYGARVSLSVGFVGATIAMLIGTSYGMIAGYYGGRLDNLMMRFIDFLYAIPDLALFILLQIFFKAIAAERERVGPFGQALVDIDRSMGGLFFLFIVLGLLSWIGIARLARGQTLSYKQKEFVEAARAIGARDRRIIFTHLLPNVFGPLVVVGVQSVAGFIGVETALSYLGIGVNAPTPSWGSMIATAQNNTFGAYPHLVLVPATMLTLTVLSFYFLADGLRDALDPSLRGS